MKLFRETVVFALLVAGISIAIVMSVNGYQGPSIEEQIDIELEAISQRAAEVEVKSERIEELHTRLDSLKALPKSKYRTAQFHLVGVEARQLYRFGKEVQYLDSVSFAKIDSLENLLK